MVPNTANPPFPARFEPKPASCREPKLIEPG
jgi:hypothetical protein